MKWLRRRDRTIRVDLTDGDEATAARRAAERRWERVHRVVQEREELHAANHFAEKVRYALEGR